MFLEDMLRGEECVLLLLDVTFREEGCLGMFLGDMYKGEECLVTFKKETCLEKLREVAVFDILD